MEYDFEHYLKAGHGRAYLIAKKDPEKYRDKILEACRKDYAFDMQCEGSRAFLTADLVSLFEDKTPFIEAAQVAFDDPSTDTDLHQMHYLSDLLLEFGKRRSLIAKFEKMEKAIYEEDSDDLLVYSWCRSWCSSWYVLSFRLRFICVSLTKEGRYLLFICSCSSSRICS